MSALRFFETRMGVTFYGKTMPQIARALSDIAKGMKQDTKIDPPSTSEMFKLHKSASFAAGFAKAVELVRERCEDVDMANKLADDLTDEWVLIQQKKSPEDHEKMISVFDMLEAIERLCRVATEQRKGSGKIVAQEILDLLSGKFTTFLA